MTDNTAATAPWTSARNPVLSPLESIPHAVGSAVVSEHISAVGVDVSDVRPLIGRDVRDFKECTVDEIRQALLERCTDSSQSFPEKLPTLLETSIKTVLPLYNINGAGIAPKVKQYLSDFCDPEKEAATYSRFVDAANSALVELKNVNAPGILAFESLKTNILFYVLAPQLQRMRHKQWGLDTVFEPGFSGEIKVEDKNLKHTVDLQLYLNSQGRTTHSGLRGRATTVFPVQSKVLSNLPKKSYFLNKSAELVAKEEARQSEFDILEEVYKIAKEEPDVLGHVPEMIWFYKFDGTSTAIIRRALGFDNAELGHRVLHIIVFKKLTPITTLEKKEFLVAWWDVVKCHRALWRRGVHHRDVSPNNLMGYRLGDNFISVLNDFDLASIIQLLSSIKQRTKGFERTGTVPFMSLDLLTEEAIAGEVEHVYRHDAESFIWVLTWICLRYEEGKLLRKGRPLDEWLTVDAIGCHKEKMGFMGRLRIKRPTRSHEDNFGVVKRGLAVVYEYAGPLEIVPTDDEVVFKAMLQDNVPADVREGNVLPGQ